MVLQAAQDPNRQGCFIGQKIKALRTEVNPLSSASSHTVQHPESRSAPLTAHGWDQGPAAPTGDAQLAQGCREQLTMRAGCRWEQLKRKAKPELPQANLPAVRAGLPPGETLSPDSDRNPRQDLLLTAHMGLSSLWPIPSPLKGAGAFPQLHTEPQSSPKPTLFPPCPAAGRFPPRLHSPVATEGSPNAPGAGSTPRHQALAYLAQHGR